MGKVFDRPAVIRANKACDEGLFLLELEVDDIPGCLKPGQFIHAQIPGMPDHILRRPFSVFFADKERSTLTILYQCVGVGTKHLSRLEPGVVMDVMGPIGRGWKLPVESVSVQDVSTTKAPAPVTPAQDAFLPEMQARKTFAPEAGSAPKRTLLVGGGVGAAPLYMHAVELVQTGFDVQVVLGAKRREALVVLDWYERLLDNKILVATDDGSFGHHGFCTDLVAQELACHTPDYVACCGPEPMMQRVVHMTLDAHIPTAVSLERRMACGIGACLSCVVTTTQGNKRSCVDGPVFNASEVIWNA